MSKDFYKNSDWTITNIRNEKNPSVSNSDAQLAVLMDIRSQLKIVNQNLAHLHTAITKIKMGKKTTQDINLKLPKNILEILNAKP